jgi:hypothetical protein
MKYYSYKYYTYSNKNLSDNIGLFIYNFILYCVRIFKKATKAYLSIVLTQYLHSYNNLRKIDLYFLATMINILSS